MITHEQINLYVPEMTLSSMDFVIESPLVQHQEQNVIDHINEENRNMDTNDTIIRKILNALSSFGDILSCRQINSIGITIDFPTVLDMMRYKSGRTAEDMNCRVSDLILKSSRGMGYTIDERKILIEAYYSIGRDTESGFDVASDFEIDLGKIFFLFNNLIFNT